MEFTTVEHTAWIVKVFDVGIGIPLLASVERSGADGFTSDNDKIAKPFRFRQSTSSRNADKKQKSLLDFRRRLIFGVD